MRPAIISMLLLLPLLLGIYCQKSKSIKIGYLLTSDLPSPEDKAVLQWLDRSQIFKPVTIDINRINQKKGLDLIWVHVPDSNVYKNKIDKVSVFPEIQKYIEKGGKLLLTDYAALIPYDLEIETVKPDIKIIKIENEWLSRKKGFQSFRGHPLFSELFGGSFIWDSGEDNRLPIIGFFEKTFPERGKVVATEKSFITINADHRLVIEYDNLPGKIISVGGFVYFAKKNLLDYNLQKFIENCLTYLDGSNEGKKTYWQKYDNLPKEFEITTEALEKNVNRNLVINDLPDMVLTRDNSKNEYFDVEGRRALIMGKEKGGIDEFWVHPFRVLRDYQAGIVKDGKLIRLDNFPVKIEVRPESFIRNYITPYGQLREVLLPSLNDGGGIIHYETDAGKLMNLVIKFRSDLRWMWPYDEFAIGDVCYGYDEALQAFHLRDSAGDLYGVIGGDKTPIQLYYGQFEDINFSDQGFSGTKTNLNQVYLALEYNLKTGGDSSLNIAVAGSNLGQSEALQNYRKLLDRPQFIYDEAFVHYKQLLDNSITIKSPDPEFNQLWKWAIIGTDRFWVNTPDLGTALVAGYATTARGWNGGHKISGRPGYAWYFGRDSEWSGFAIDNYGDFEAIHQQLMFLQKYQDLAGKIFHEISTSGVVHYDAADATPLYVILAAHYLRASGDIGFIRESWNHVQKAMSFLYSTDTDQDGLIENTNVGHGWVEGGKLWGAHTTLYLASLWAQALKDAAYLANHLGEFDLARKYQNNYSDVIHIINNDFWNETKQFYYYGKLSDGNYNSEPTVLPAVAMYFDLLDEQKVQKMLNTYASNEFSADWGVRILSSESSLYNPQGYHYGSVWPLFTGWTSLAEYNYGYSVQGFAHIVDNLLIKNHWSLGFAEEVMNGAKYEPSGVCPHQCWSETNILHPGIHGMIGWRPNAPEQEAVLAPRFPINWDSIYVENLKMGESSISFQKDQKKNETVYTIRLQKGGPVSLRFQPEIPTGMEIKSIRIDNREINVPKDFSRSLISTPISVQLTGEHRIHIEHANGIMMVPKICRPKPGDNSSGYRILNSYLTGNQFEVLLEGKSGTQSEFELKIFDQKIKRITGAKVLQTSPEGIIKIQVYFPESRHRFVQKNVKVEIG